MENENCAKCLWCGKEIKGEKVRALVDRGQPAKDFHPECFFKMRDAMDPPRELRQ
jgi:hypothetical protein